MAAVILTAAGSLWAEPLGYSINSRGLDRDDQRVNALWRIDLSNGNAEYIGWTSFLDVEALALSPAGALYGADDDTNTLVRVSTVTGLAQPLGGAGNRFNTGLLPLDRKLDFGMTFTCEGDLYVVSDVEQSLFLADIENGQLSTVGADGALGSPITDIAAFGDQVYGIGVGLTSTGQTAAPNLYRIDLDIPSAELVGPLGPAAAPYNNAGLSFDADGTLWAVTDRRAVGGQDLPSQILRIDPASGIAQLVAESLIGLESLAVAPPSGCRARAQPSPGHAIPILSRGGLVLLSLLMLMLGALSLRRHLS
ncbi:MAG: hypothetical protein EA419_02190 [Wenzhouxiangella sp.]|nr:MAG: hypothetical protein EA419_02190 [Wenzhouxiangella sp.]